MPRESEKVLMKELEQAIKRRDELADKAMKAHGAWASARDAHDAVNAEVRGLLNAVASLRSRGEIVSDTHRRNVEREAYESMNKEKPVA